MHFLYEFETDLGFGLDADIERGNPGGEDTGDPLTSARVQEMETGFGQLLEPAPPLQDAYACLVYAGKKPKARIAHLELEFG